MEKSSALLRQKVPAFYLDSWAPRSGTRFFHFALQNLQRLGGFNREVEPLPCAAALRCNPPLPPRCGPRVPGGATPAYLRRRHPQAHPCGRRDSTPGRAEPARHYASWRSRGIEMMGSTGSTASLLTAPSSGPTPLVVVATTTCPALLLNRLSKPLRGHTLVLRQRDQLPPKPCGHDDVGVCRYREIE